MSQEKKRLKVVHYCNQLSIGGTERTMELFCKYLDPSKFEIFAVSCKSNEKFLKKIKIELGSFLGIKSARTKKKLANYRLARIDNFNSILGRDHLFLAKSTSDLKRILNQLSPDILHIHYSGRAEPPSSEESILKNIPVTVTTNQFELENTAPSHRYVKKMLFVSNWLVHNKAHWAKHDLRTGVLYNPVELPCSSESLRNELGIPQDAFVVGRIGRPDPGIHDPISLRAYRQIEDEKTYFLALAAPENMIRQAETFKLKNFIALPANTNEQFLSRFYNTIDVLAHARRDGETFGCNIAEAMIHEKPVISHISAFMNAQTETIGPAGYVSPQDDWRDYAEHLLRLKNDPSLRSDLALQGKKYALENFEARAQAKKLEGIYYELWNQK